MSFLHVGSLFAFYVGDRNPFPREVLSTRGSYRQKFWRFYSLGPACSRQVVGSYVRSLLKYGHAAA